MGRRKIDIQPLTNERNRLVTFQKVSILAPEPLFELALNILQRKNGLFKKAYELGVLCSVDVAVIIFTPGQHNKLFEFCSGNIDEIVLRRLNYEGERDLKTTMDFVDGAGHLRGAGNSATAGMAESEDDDDDNSDTKPSKRKAPGTRSRPARATSPTTDTLHNDSPRKPASSTESLLRSSSFSVSDRLPDRARSDEHDHPTTSRQANAILRPGSSASNPDYRRIPHFGPLRSGLKSDWPSPRLDSGGAPSHHHSPSGSGSLLGSSALLGLDAHYHHHHAAAHHHQELLSNNFARHRTGTLAHSVGGPSIGRRLTAPYSAATPPRPTASLTGAGSAGGGDDSWLDFLAIPSSLSLLADHPTALGASHPSAGYDFPFGLGLGGPGRGSGNGSGGLGIGGYGLPEGADLDKERDLLARQGGNEFGPRKRPRWE